MGAQLGSKGGPISDINVTPLIDVVLVLLVVFMVITPMLQSGLPVDLPKATQTETVNDAGQHIVVSMAIEKGLYVEQEQVVDQEGLTPDVIHADENKKRLIDLINFEFRSNPERSILIKADRRLEYQQVRALMDVLAENRLTAVYIAAAKEK
ncbi:MAG TPA: biopolymer transporter ExbD [Myxococcota bacterium]|nr:biopolymer transporter ExbD [Myxococcota bacterium]